MAGTLVLRRWDPASGLHETRREFHSLEELYALCLAARPPEFVDRLVLEGVDSNDELRTLLFTYEASTGSESGEEGA